MSLINPNTLHSQLLVQQTVMPYTFTTGELDTLKVKLQSAENQLLNNPKQQLVAILQITSSEIKTLLKMIEMTYMQGLSGSGVLPTLSSHDMQTNNGKQPSGNYVCRKCHIPGHFIQDCPNVSSSNFQQRNQNIPPNNYVCRKCNIGGHWIQNCTANQQQDYNKSPPDNYFCHRCGQQGHWIKNCPTNGNPMYDNKLHMSSMQQQQRNNNTNSNDMNNNDDDNNNNSSLMQQSNFTNGKFQKRFVKKTM